MANTREVTVSGPLFDGRAHLAVEAYLDAATKLVAEHAANLVKTRLDQVLQHPTGHYRSLIQTDRQQNEWAVTDSNCVYGPWLEGVGSRNETTAFKGYGTFRLVIQELKPLVEVIAEPILLPYVAKMN
jgi:hypothetical protein